MELGPELEEADPGLPPGGYEEPPEPEPHGEDSWSGGADDEENAEPEDPRRDLEREGENVPTEPAAGRPEDIDAGHEAPPPPPASSSSGPKGPGPAQPQAPSRPASKL